MTGPCIDLQLWSPDMVDVERIRIPVWTSCVRACDVNDSNGLFCTSHAWVGNVLVHTFEHVCRHACMHLCFSRHLAQGSASFASLSEFALEQEP